MTQKACLLLIVILAASTVIMIEVTSAQIPKPSVPEFTVKLVDRSYDVPETSAINQYTGQTVITPAHHVQNYTVELTIKNQPITSTVIEEGTATWNAELRYDVNVKGHFAQNWTIMYLLFEGPKPSNSDYTTITYELVSSPNHPEQGFELRSFFDDIYGSNTITGIPGNSRLDFRVRAMYGAMHRGNNPDATNPLERYPWVFDGEISDWSSTQTVTIGSSESTPTANPSSSNPSVASPSEKPTTLSQQGTQASAWGNNLDWTEVALFAAIGVIAALLLVIVFMYRQKKTV